MGDVIALTNDVVS